MSCTAATDCASGQVCGTDRFCASPELAGRCASLPTDDGGTPIPPTHDAGAIVDGASVTPGDASPDAPMTKQLHIKVDGQGGVSVLAVGICDSAPPQKGDCRFDVFLQTPLHAEAYTHIGWRFDKWTDGPCKDDEAKTCDFTPAGPIELKAKFRRDD